MEITHLTRIRRWKATFQGEKCRAVRMKKVTAADPPKVIMQEARDETKKMEETPKKLWVDVISGNRNPSNRMQMDFVSPKVVNGVIEIEIEEEDIIFELKY